MNPYETLGIKKDATQQDIKKAYRDMSKKHHPDVGGDERKFQAVNLAYRVLSDPEKRKLYDDQGIVMDESPNHINNLINARLADIAEKWIDNMLRGSKVPLQQFVLGGFKEAMITIKRENGKIKITIGKLKNIRKRLKYKSEDSIFHRVIDTRIGNYEKGIHQNKMELILLEQLEVIIKDYEYEEEIEEVIMNTSSTVSFDTRGFGFGPGPGNGFPFPGA